MLVAMCEAPLPLAVEPLWQEEQEPVTPVWSNTADQELVRWQSSQRSLEGMWLPGLPRALLPLWQLRQLPVTGGWVKLLAFQLPMVWQLSH
ncbi:MAG: hypothetical protein D6786_07670 [Gammaproteobacteria bacterium]|nr:MAG: hypothetical protein D6786_07670 [Gammaproteobacteria bacterium]